MTTASEIDDWFERGVKHRATHLIVVCDTFDHEDYPVYAMSDEDCLVKHKSHNGLNMQRVMEVYDLRADKAEQMKGKRVMRLPKEPT